MGFLLGLLVGGGLMYAVSKFGSASAQEATSGTLIINDETGALYLLGADGLLHRVLDPSALTAEQIASQAIHVDNEGLSQYGEGGALFCS